MKVVGHQDIGVELKRMPLDHLTHQGLESPMVLCIFINSLPLIAAIIDGPHRVAAHGFAFLAKLTTFSGLVNGAGLTHASPMSAMWISCSLSRNRSLVRRRYTYFFSRLLYSFTVLS